MKNEVRYEENPFIEELVIRKKGKRVTVSPFGSQNQVLLNQETGEIKGTSVTTFREVDDEQFIKLFTQNIALTFNLGSAGIKAFNLLGYALQKAIREDRVSLDKYLLKEFLSEDDHVNLKLSEPTMMRGLKELEKAKIIAKTIKRGDYFVNPAFVFNGDRISFTNIIERKRK